MGLYDRDYIRRSEPGIHLSGIQTITTKIVLVTAGVYLVQQLTRTGVAQGWFNDLFVLHADFWRQPWRCFELVTYGFLHAVLDIRHILFNMLVLWFLGRDVEDRYGPREFLFYYLAAIAFAGLVWSLAEYRFGNPRAVCLGASGGVSAVMVLFALNFPQRKLRLLFFPFFPIPAWIIAALVVLSDALGALNVAGQGQVAYAAHLGGALFALIYFKSGFRLAGWVPTGWGLPRIRRGPKLRVHHPGPVDQQDEDIDRKVDEILRKIREQGQDSLTRQEKRLLEKASREYQRRQR